MVQAGGSSAPFAFEVNVVVVMVVFAAGQAAERVFGAAFIIQHFMDDTFIQKRFQRPVNGYAVIVRAETLLEVAVREGVAGF